MKLLFCHRFLVGKVKHQIKLCEANFDVAQEYEALRKYAPKAGAIVFFVGLVRDLYGDKNEESPNKNVSEKAERVDYIELTHYAGMTELLCQKIIEEADELFSPDAIRVVHRVGKLYSGEQIVMVAVASSHREQAFKACQFVMDYLKTRATLWKKEVGERGEKWVSLKEKDQAAANRWA